MYLFDYCKNGFVELWKNGGGFALAVGLLTLAYLSVLFAGIATGIPVEQANSSVVALLAYTPAVFFVICAVASFVFATVATICRVCRWVMHGPQDEEDAFATGRDGPIAACAQTATVSGSITTGQIRTDNKGTTMTWVAGLLVGAGVVMGTCFTLQATSDPSHYFLFLFFAGIFPIGLGLSLFLVSIYNRLVAGKNRCHMAMSNVDVLLRRRFDLVGNLVAVVAQYATHENKTFKEVAAYRSRATAPSSMAAKAEEVARRVAPTFVAIAEAYPKLKADKSYRDLFDQLRETEDSIASARLEFNKAVMEQNTRISTFPDMLIARKFGFVEHPFFSASEGHDKAITIGRPSKPSSPTVKE